MANGKILYYTKPAEYFTEAEPLGNGSIGAMVYGGTKREKISLNCDTLWSGLPKAIKKEGAYEAFLEGKKAALDGDYEKAHRVISEGFLGTNSEVYLPMGTMFLDFADAEITGYERRLDLETGVFTVSYTADGTKITREYFVSYPDSVLVVRVSADKPKSVSFTLSFESRLKSSVSVEGDTVYLDGECPYTCHADDPRNVMEYEYSDLPEKRGVMFRAGARIATDGEMSETVGGAPSLTVKNADGAVVIFSAKTSFNGYDRHPCLEGREYIVPLERTLDDAEALGFEKLKKNHVDDYSELFSRVRLDLGESGREGMPTDERLKRFAEDGDDASLYTLLFDFARYLTIASSRKGTQATCLQGIWNESMTPPWRSNYTVNINTEMNYWCTLMCGLDECFEPLIGFMRDRCEAGKATASHYYHARGTVMHHNSDIWAHTTGVTNNAQWGFWNGAMGWLCREIYEYYEYMLDEKYLAETAYPIMRESALFYLDLLTDRGDGKLSVVPSTSPENVFIYGGGKRASVAKYTAMSDSIAYDLFKNCLSAAKVLGISDGFTDEVEAAVGKMSPLEIGSDGRLLEWNEEFDETEITHRHLSHLYALHPARLITPDGTPELAEACRKVMERRGDNGTGWSLAWKINFAARLGEGDHALRLLKMQLNPVAPEIDSWQFTGGTYPNLFDAHPPFQIDGNFGAASGIIEMLIGYGENGEFTPLPALPSEWKSGKIEGIRLRGGKVLNMEWSGGKVSKCEVLEI